MQPGKNQWLANHTTLELGGPAEFFVAAARETAVLDAWRWARTRDLPLRILGGGSNVVIADEGVIGLVLAMRTKGIWKEEKPSSALFTVAAGESWDEFVDLVVSDGYAGLECLSGIPGLVGATPIQNVGAYGQEVAHTLHAVHAWDCDNGEETRLSPQECTFTYRNSVFKQKPARYIVLSVAFELRKESPQPRYEELRKALELRSARPDVTLIRQTVLDLRKKKSMVLDPTDENRRSVGSFFLNPVLDAQELQSFFEKLKAVNLADAAVPRFDAGEGKTKIPAAWLVEQTGFTKASRYGAFGISSNHALALVHHGGGRTSELLSLAHKIQSAVQDRFGIRLELEPTRW